LFQSLIGTLQTVVGKIGEYVHAEFQSLIGTLQTATRGNLPVTQSQVSIPHRYATNENATQKGLSCGAVSIPHRYATNYQHSHAIRWIILVSIPHRYATNVMPASIKSPRKTSFNPS